MPTGRYSPGGQKAAAKGELLKNSVKAKFGIASAQTAQDRRRGSLVLIGIRFLMYR
jgi:hypothetical protein